MVGMIYQRSATITRDALHYYLQRRLEQVGRVVIDARSSCNILGKFAASDLVKEIQVGKP
jgi:hypothetical protein